MFTGTAAGYEATQWLRIMGNKEVLNLKQQHPQSATTAGTSITFVEEMHRDNSGAYVIVALENDVL